MLKFAVFGNPISHSISPLLHNYAIKEFGIDGFYGRVCLSKTESKFALKNSFEKLGLSGANITLPFKEIGLSICDELSSDAKEIGSVNTIVKRSDEIYGYNTDTSGFFDAAVSMGEFKNALIIGCGGTTKAISYILYKNRVKFDILNRTKRDKKTIELLKCNNFYTWNDKELLDGRYDLVINATSAGLNDEFLPAPKELLELLLKRAKFGFDLIYGKNTPFLQLCLKNSLIAKDGLDMLIGQAVLAFELFFDGKFKKEEIALLMKKAAALRVF